MEVEDGRMAKMGPENAGSGPPLQGWPGPAVAEADAPGVQRDNLDESGE